MGFGGNIESAATPAAGRSETLRVVVFDKSSADARELAEALCSLGLAHPVEVVRVSKVTELSRTMRDDVDVLFMDLGEPGSPYDGVDYVRTLVGDDSFTKVIFTGSQKGAHRRVYLVDHLWYLPKPIDAQELRDAMDKALRSIEEDRERPFVVLSDRSDVVIRPREVRFVESRLRVLRIHERDRVVDTYANLSAVAAKLPSSFVRCHRSFLVNLDFVRRMSDKGLELSGGEVVPVSERRRAVTRDALRTYFGGLLL